MVRPWPIAHTARSLRREIGHEVVEQRRSPMMSGSQRRPPSRGVGAPGDLCGQKVSRAWPVSADADAGRRRRTRIRTGSAREGRRRRDTCQASRSAPHCRSVGVTCWAMTSNVLSAHSKLDPGPARRPGPLNGNDTLRTRYSPSVSRSVSGYSQCRRLVERSSEIHSLSGSWTWRKTSGHRLSSQVLSALAQDDRRATSLDGSVTPPVR